MNPSPFEPVNFGPMHCRTFREFRQGTAQVALPVAFDTSLPDVSIHLSHTLDGDIERQWNQLVGDTSVFLHSRYIHALGELGDQLNYRFAWFMREHEMVGIAAFQLTYAESDDASSNIDGQGVFSRIASKVLRNRKISFRVLVLGNSFATGEHAYRFTSAIENEEQIQLLNEAMRQVKAAEKKAGERISATVIKDFYPEHFQEADRFGNHGFADFFVDPNMILPLKNEWTSFDDYLMALTSKYRTKARAALKRSESLEIRELTVADLNELRDGLHALYNQVYDRADFKLGKLSADCFFNLKETLTDCFTLKGFFLNGQLVGFQSGFFYNGWLDAHFVGIDYEHNYRHAIYQRMLYEYIRMGIESGAERISFGRTAMEIKSTVGAFPVDLKCYIRHRKKAPNTLLKLLFGYVKPSEYHQRIAFKKRELEDLEV